jgi:hypothetical protein
VQGLRLLAANPDYNLEFYDESVRGAIDSRDALYVKTHFYHYKNQVNRV